MKPEPKPKGGSGQRATDQGVTFGFGLVKGGIHAFSPL
jgi:hypothetical protein